ncbi:MAG: HD domain-containing protein [Candidatus Omnitrophica bacterium]|nr:HD domain-containing protein [Candidatus Omnitrophota bacterium]
MAGQMDFSIVSLEWASKVLGAHLDIEKVVAEILNDFKRSIPVKSVSLALWDGAKRRFSLDVSSGRKAVHDPVLPADVMPAVHAKEPLITKRTVVVPLLDRTNFIGIMIFGDKRGFFKYKDAIERSAALIAATLANVRLFVESEIRTQDMFRFNVLSRALNPTVHEEEIVKILLQGLEGIMRYDMAGLLVIGKHSQKLFIKALTPVPRSAVAAVRKNLLELTRNLTKKELDLSKIEQNIAVPPGKAPARTIKSMLDAPLITKGKFLGVLALCSFAKENFSARDSQNISTLVSHGAVAFENAMLYQDLRRTYFSIIRALTSAIEAKDEYTRGHSVLVSKFSAAIAEEMGLSPSMVESIQIAGLLHDLGKIGVPEEILVKKGKLTDNEYGVVKAHPDIALKILGPVEFPHFTSDERAPGAAPELTLNLFEGADLSSEVKLMIYHHHEKFSGGGYPKGSAGEEIPLGARILSVSDTFEALTADRPYRKAFTLPEALKVLRKISGEQLDPKIVNVFIKLIREKGVETLKAQAEI